MRTQTTENVSSCAWMKILTAFIELERLVSNLMKQFSVFATLAAGSGGSAPSR